MGRQVVVSGFATVDYIVRATGVFGGRGTMTMVEDPGRLQPRAGGAPLYASLALAQAGHAASPLTWLGDDEHRHCYQMTCRSSGVRDDGVAVLAGARTSTCLLIYNTDGSYGCLINPMSVAATPQQFALVAGADALVVAAGDPDASMAIMDWAKPGALIAWIAKSDPACFPPALLERLAATAAVIFCNESERARIDAAPGRRSDQIIFETCGDRGVIVDQADGRTFCPVEPVQVHDATGAGDTFAGAALGALLNGRSAIEAAAAGSLAATNLLRARLSPPAPR